MVGAKTVLAAGIIGGLLAGVTIGPLGYGLGYYQASAKFTQRLSDCQGKLAEHIEADSKRVLAESEDLASKMENFTKVQKELSENASKSAAEERKTQRKLQDFENEIKKLEVPECVAVDVGSSLHKLNAKD